MPDTPTSPLPPDAPEVPAQPDAARSAPPAASPQAGRSGQPANPADPASPAGPASPTDPAGSRDPAGSPEPSTEQATDRTRPAAASSPLSLAALASVAVPGLDPVRLAQPQTLTEELRITGVIDTKGRHWEVLQARTDAAGASLDAEAEVLRRLGRQRDDGRLSFDVPRPAGSLRREGSHIQVRSHIEGSPINLASLRPGPGLSASLGQALGELHDLPTTVVSEAGLPVYDAEEVRQRWLTLLDDAAATGKVPPALLARWEEVLEDTALWRFRPTVVHGDLAEENILTAGGGVVALLGLTSMHVGDPAEDLAWLYATAPVDCLDSIEDAYERSRREGVDAHARDRAELVSEMSLARWLMHGVRAADQSVIDDAVSMLTDLLTQVAGDEPEEPGAAVTEVLDAAELRAAGLETAAVGLETARPATEADADRWADGDAPAGSDEPAEGRMADDLAQRADRAELPETDEPAEPADSHGEVHDRASDAVEPVDPHDAETAPIPTDPADPTKPADLSRPGSH